MEREREVGRDNERERAWEGKRVCDRKGIESVCRRVREREKKERAKKDK